MEIRTMVMILGDLSVSRGKQSHWKGRKNVSKVEGDPLFPLSPYSFTVTLCSHRHSKKFCLFKSKFLSKEWYRREMYGKCRTAVYLGFLICKNNIYFRGLLGGINEVFSKGMFAHSADTS